MSEKSLKERFQEKLDGSRWTGSTNNIGYPKMKVDGEMVLGSHVALQLAGRKVPTGGPAGGKIVMHKDNNKLNLSPSNLAVGTHKANLKQMRDEGRDRPRGVHQEPDEKVAIDIRRAVLPEMGSVMGKYLNPAQVAANPLASGLARGRPHLLVEKPLSELRAMAGNMRDFAGKPELIEQAANALQKNTRRHELTHYLRGKAGKMEGVGQPGIRNVLRTGREELIAYTKGVDAFDKMGPQYVSQAAKGVIPGAVASVREAYPQGVAHAALGGTLKPVRDLAQRFGLMKQGHDIDILKFAFKLQDAKSVAQAVKSKIVKPGHAVAAGPSYLPRHAEALGDATRIGKAMGLPRGVTTAAVQETMQNVGNLGGRITWPRKGDATSFLRHGMEEEGAGLQHASEYLKDLPTSVTAQLQASVQHNKDKLNALRSVRSPADRQIMDGLIKSHELAEATVRPQMGFAHFGHRSPKVILQEQNAVATLPPGSTVGPAMTALRRGKESEVLKSVGVDYGAKRYSRHAVKHLSNDIEQASLKQFKDAYPDGKIAFKLQGHAEFQGIQIAIENRKGSVRKGTDKDGKPWRTVMRMPYGFVKGTKGADGEEIDCYIGPHKNAPNVYAVHQHKSDGTGYDEDKLIFGVRSKEEASKRYLQHYNSDKFLGPVKEVPVERLKEMLSTGKKLEKIALLNNMNPYARKMLIGGVVGAVTGAAAGAGHEYVHQPPPSPTSFWAQALDNQGADFMEHGGERVHHTVGREELVSRVSNVAKSGDRVASRHALPGESVWHTDRHIMVEVPRPDKDVVGRVAPLVMHADRRMGVEAALELARSKAKEKLASISSSLCTRVLRRG